jgi:hypothetical protein
VTPEYPEVADVSVSGDISRCRLYDGLGHANFMLAGWQCCIRFIHIASNNALSKVEMRPKVVTNMFLAA